MSYDRTTLVPCVDAEPVADIPEFLCVKPVPNKGLGVVALAKIYDDKIIGEYTGQRTIISPSPFNRYSFDVEPATGPIIHIDASRPDAGWPRYINTSLPKQYVENVEFKQIDERIFIITIREIQRGEEILAYYGDQYFVAPDDSTTKFSVANPPHDTTRLLRGWTDAEIAAWNVTYNIFNWATLFDTLHQDTVAVLAIDIMGDTLTIYNARVIEILVSSTRRKFYEMLSRNITEYARINRVKKIVVSRGCAYFPWAMPENVPMLTINTISAARPELREALLDVVIERETDRFLDTLIDTTSFFVVKDDTRVLAFGVHQKELSLVRALFVTNAVSSLRQSAYGAGMRRLVFEFALRHIDQDYFGKEYIVAFPQTETVDSLPQNIITKKLTDMLSINIPATFKTFRRVVVEYIDVGTLLSRLSLD